MLTGETGAGKSILLDALGLVLGNRADSGLVRAGEDRASVTASFEFAALPPALAGALDEAEIEIEPGEPLILKRTLSADGGSKAFVNDQPVGVALLRDMAPHLVELHGQHDDRGLVNPRGHRALLDRFAGSDAAGVAAAWRAWRAAEDALAAAREQRRGAQADQDLLLAHLAELTALAPLAGEEEAPRRGPREMQKGERLSGDLAELRHLWAGSDSALAELRGAARRLDRIAAEHPLLAEALAALDRAVIEAGEAEDRLAARRRGADPRSAVLDRDRDPPVRSARAARKHGCKVDELPDRMLDLRAHARRHRGRRGAVRRAGSGGHGSGRALSRARRARSTPPRSAAAERLDEAVAGELAPLKLDAARFRTAVSDLPEERWGPTGIDAVEFLIATNPGADSRR